MTQSGEWISLTTALATGAVTLLAVLTWRTYRHLTIFKRMGMPGPRPLPVIGNMGSFANTGFGPVIKAWVEDYGKVFGMHFMTPSVVIADRELTREVMIKRFSSFSDRPEMPGFGHGIMKNTLLNLKGDHWKHVRNQLSPAFSSNKLKKLCPSVRRVASQTCRHLEGKVESGEMLDLAELCQNVTMDVIAGVVFGHEVNSLTDPDDPFVKHAKHLMDSLAKKVGLVVMLPFLASVLDFFGVGLMPKADVDYFVGIFDAALEERRRENTKYDDFLQLILEAEKARYQQEDVDEEIDFRKELRTSAQWTRKGMTPDEMLANSLMFFFAGYDTMATMMSMTLFALAANPHCLQKAQKELDEKVGAKTLDYDTAMELTYLDMCMFEAMRTYLPSTSMLMRTASEDTELAGYKIPKGMQIILAGVYHTEPDEFPEPDKYDPERHRPEERAKRHPISFLPFGAGPRNCIGMRLAQLEIRILLGTILQRFSPLLCEKSVVPPVLKPMMIVSKDGLWVRIQRREDIQHEVSHHGH